jgi:hypothetical protein
MSGPGKGRRITPAQRQAIGLELFVETGNAMRALEAAKDPWQEGQRGELTMDAALRVLAYAGAEASRLLSGRTTRPQPPAEAKREKLRAAGAPVDDLEEGAEDDDEGHKS